MKTSRDGTIPYEEAGDHDDVDSLDFLNPALTGFEGDRRSREAKMFKQQRTKDERDLEEMIRVYQNKNESIQRLIGTLESLKQANISKKELKQHRNRVSAMLCRELAKLEVNFLKLMCIKQQRHIRKLETERSYPKHL